MAGDWMKIEKSTPMKPEIQAMAVELDMDPDEVFGKLFRVWAWFDDQTVDGNAASVTKITVNRITNVLNFAEVMEKVGWLRVKRSGLQLPNFDRHNGQTSKRRALTAKRAAKFKAKKGNASSVTSALPREEKRREELKALKTCVGWCKKNGFSGIDKATIADWKEAYPSVDIEVELKRMSQWLISNPTKATKKQWRRFITAWLGRSQKDSNGGNKNNRSSGAGRNFKPAKSGTPIRKTDDDRVF